MTRSPTRRRLRGAILLAVALPLAVPRTARSATCPAMPGASPELAAVESEARLRFVAEAMSRSARRSRIWAYTWAGVYAASTVGNLAAQPWRKEEDRVDGWIAAGTSAIGVASIALRPPRVLGDLGRLEQLAAAWPADADRCALLVEAERLLVRSAKSQEFGRGLFMHAAVTLFNVGVSLTLGFALGHWLNAGINLGTGMFISTLQLNTQPADLSPALERYRRGELVSGKEPRRFGMTWVPMVGADRIGLGVAGAF